MAGKETQLVKSILLWLDVRYQDSLLVFRHNTGATETASRGFIRYGCPGSPDIIGIQMPQGRFVGFECKSETGRCSSVQRTWLLRAASMGALVGVVRSIADVEKMLSTGQCRLEELSAEPKAAPTPKTPRKRAPAQKKAGIGFVEGRKPAGADRLSFSPPYGSATRPVWVDAAGQPLKR